MDALDFLWESAADDGGVDAEGAAVEEASSARSMLPLASRWASTVKPLIATVASFASCLIRSNWSRSSCRLFHCTPESLCFFESSAPSLSVICVPLSCALKGPCHCACSCPWAASLPVRFAASVGSLIACSGAMSTPSRLTLPRNWLAAILTEPFAFRLPPSSWAVISSAAAGADTVANWLMLPRRLSRLSCVGAGPVLST